MYSYVPVENQWVDLSNGYSLTLILHTPRTELHHEILPKCQEQNPKKWNMKLLEFEKGKNGLKTFKMSGYF